MNKLFSVAPFILLTGCNTTGWKQAFVPTVKAEGLDTTEKDRAVPSRPVSSTVVQERTAANDLTALCRFAREALGLPAKVNPTVRSQVYEKAGKPLVNQLLTPVAKSNNAFRCLCGTPEERVNAKCGG